MAANLLKAGARLVIRARSQHTLTELSENQVVALDTPREIVQAAETVILMLPDARAVESVLNNLDGLLDGANAKTTIVDMGTTEAGVIEQLKSGLHALGARSRSGRTALNVSQVSSFATNGRKR